MNDTDLLARIEQQAVRIAQLESENKLLQSIVDGVPSRMDEAERNIYLRLANTSVNCNGGGYCRLASRYLERCK